VKSIEIMAPVHGWVIAFADADDVEGHGFTISKGKGATYGSAGAKDDDDVEGHGFTISKGKGATYGSAGAKDDDEDVEGHAFISSGGTSRTGTTKG